MTVFGAGGGTSSYREIEDADLIIFWGSNAREAHPIFFHHALKAIHKGAKVYSDKAITTGMSLSLLLFFLGVSAAISPLVASSPLAR